MKTVLAAINAKFIHTNPAVRSVAQYAAAQGVNSIKIWERTINQRYQLLLRELVDQKADVLIFSCYIWNINLILSLAADLRQIHPHTILLAAGPEVSHEWQDLWKQNPFFDGVLPGEGERLTTELLKNISAKGKSCLRNATAEWLQCKLSALPIPPVSMDTLPFPYPDLDELNGRIVYYESMRGCPFRCGYCLSSIDDQPVRFRNLEQVFSHMERFIRTGVRQVKFVDRTFNCDLSRSKQLFRWLIERDTGVTSFHFEMAGELLDEEILQLLSGARSGLFQFEIGIQSTNPQTLSAIDRPNHLEQVFHNIQELQKNNNIHLHLDLIAGLPFEDYPSFAGSFDTVFAQSPHQLQLGFLKLLKGSTLRQEAPQYQIRYRQQAPYEVLETKWLSFSHLSRLHGIADMVELYYNSGRFSHLLLDLIGEFQSPFHFFEQLSSCFIAGGHEAVPPSKTGYYEILGDFMVKMGILITERRQWLCRYDMAMHEKIKKTPSWVQVEGCTPHRQRFLEFLDDAGNRTFYLPKCVHAAPKLLLKTKHIEVFPFHPESGAAGEVAILFDYDRRDIRGRAWSTDIPLGGQRGIPG